MNSEISETVSKKSCRSNNGSKPIMILPSSKNNRKKIRKTPIELETSDDDVKHDDDYSTEEMIEDIDEDEDFVCG